MTDRPTPVLTALAGQVCPAPPIWLMRQAGRYLPEYRKVRAGARSFLELCYTPDLATEVTLQPIRRYGLDAAIVFSDILVVPDALGCPVRFVEGHGPRLEALVDAAAVARLSLDRLAAHLAPVYATVHQVAAALPAAVALIGFAGAPWTVAAYMVEGEGSKDFQRARGFARRQPEAFGQLIDLLTEATIRHLGAQIDAGADLVQLFDSWAGALPESEFIRWCQRPAERIVAALAQQHPGVPVIAFPRGAGARYPSYAAAVRPAGLGLDTSISLAWAREALPEVVCLQGNLDPIALMVGGATLRAEAEHVLRTLAGRPFIFNLGHGVLPETDPGHVAELIELVRRGRPVPGSASGG